MMHAALDIICEPLAGDGVDTALGRDDHDLVAELLGCLWQSS
jgi:hypothetical protein